MPPAADLAALHAPRAVLKLGEIVDVDDVLPVVADHHSHHPGAVLVGDAGPPSVLVRLLHIAGQVERDPAPAVHRVPGVEINVGHDGSTIRKSMPLRVRNAFNGRYAALSSSAVAPSGRSRRYAS